jgi:2'-5' RNA ligase
MALELNRLFFALWPNEAVRAASAAAARDLKIRMQPAGHLSAAERYHITLLFLGDYVPVATEAAAREAAAKVSAAPFELTLDHAGSFRNNRQIPWWLGTREPPAALRALYEHLRDTLNHAGVASERMRFVPHLTVLRDAKVPLPVTSIKPIAWSVDEFVLVRSRLDLKPVRYELLGRWPLSAASTPQSSPPQTPQMSLWD